MARSPSPCMCHVCPKPTVLVPAMTSPIVELPSPPDRNRHRPWFSPPRQRAHHDIPCRLLRKQCPFHSPLHAIDEAMSISFSTCQSPSHSLPLPLFLAHAPPMLPTKPPPTKLSMCPGLPLTLAPFPHVKCATPKLVCRLTGVLPDPLPRHPTSLSRWKTVAAALCHGDHPSPISSPGLPSLARNGPARGGP
jgi:hypothetical protein